MTEVLGEYGARTQTALDQYLPRDGEHRLDPLIADYPSRGGKKMRPGLLVAAARAFGARLEDAIGTAAALELLHNALLVHDDIQDESEERRSRPALHVEHGLPLALNAGNALAHLSLQPLLDNHRALGPRVTLALFEETDRMSQESAEGQALELGWRRDNVDSVDESDYLRMVLKKTCWLATIFPVRAGVLIASRGTADLEPFIRYGFFLGAAFQIHDDVLNLIGDERYGKERDGDLWEGKRTLMIIRLLRAATEVERTRLLGVLGQPREARRERDVRWMRQRMEAYGCIDHALRFAQALAGAALWEFDRLFGHLPDSRDKRFLRAMARWVIERDH